MERAIELSVPLEVTLKCGRNWYDVEPIDAASAGTCFERSLQQCSPPRYRRSWCRRRMPI